MVDSTQVQPIEREDRMIDKRSLLAYFPDTPVFTVPRVQGPLWAAYSASELSIRTLVVVEFDHEAWQILNEVEKESRPFRVNRSHLQWSVEFGPFGHEWVDIRLFEKGRARRKYDQVFILTEDDQEKRKMGTLL